MRLINDISVSSPSAPLDSKVEGACNDGNDRYSEADNNDDFDHEGESIWRIIVSESHDHAERGVVGLGVILFSYLECHVECSSGNIDWTSDIE